MVGGRTRSFLLSALVVVLMTQPLQAARRVSAGAHAGASFHNGTGIESLRMAGVVGGAFVQVSSNRGWGVRGDASWFHFGHGEGGMTGPVEPAAVGMSGSSGGSAPLELLVVTMDVERKSSENDIYLFTGIGAYRALGSLRDVTDYGFGANFGIGTTLWQTTPQLALEAQVHLVNWDPGAMLLLPIGLVLKF